MKSVTPQQIKRLWSLSNYVENTKEQTKALIKQIAGKDSSKELTEREANRVIKELLAIGEEIEKVRKPMRSKILHLCRDCFGWSLSKDSKDWANFNEWMNKKSVHKKFLTSLTKSQLVDTINQLEKIKSRM